MAGMFEGHAYVSFHHHFLHLSLYIFLSHAVYTHLNNIKQEWIDLLLVSFYFASLALGRTRGGRVDATPPPIRFFWNF